ncbi:hypothetical protein GWI33_016813 [Rhynchophorus ferrugineus]|uniref:Uncharacterized protein n=1 Tax=Rhynchophorus ferrugineus TaxID=354439 RepID=A0A834I0D5_RHYFE|nr:hypothetical protein GWI33_016813 [Rhynchophorus ferrugineus]
MTYFKFLNYECFFSDNERTGYTSFEICTEFKFLAAKKIKQLNDKLHRPVSCFEEKDIGKKCKFRATPR